MSNDIKSLENLAHIANMSHELRALNQEMRTSQASNKIDNPSKTKKMACVECRQQKSRCDAFERHPAPCTRCTKKGYQCDLKSDYKRTYKRARMAQLEKEFSELKQSLTPEQILELIGKVPSLNELMIADAGNDRPLVGSTLSPRFMMEKLGTPSKEFPHVASVSELNSLPDINNDTTGTTIHLQTMVAKPSIIRQQDFTSPSTATNVVIPEDALICEQKKIDDITLTPVMIRALYLEYVEHYHPILPVVDILKGPERIYKLCPSLFWVMMVVSVRRWKDSSQKQLLTRLSKIVKDILAEVTISPITRFNPTEEEEPLLNAVSVFSVQAFLIYTFWPPIASSLSADSSWNTIGVAMFQAIRIGLHLPNLTEKDTDLSLEQTKTWMVCNIVSQIIATSFGFPAFVQLDLSACSTCLTQSNQPATIKFMMEIAQFEDQMAKTLNTNPLDSLGLIDQAERLPLLKILSKQLTALESKLSDELPNDDGYRKLQLLSARVHLLTYYFMDFSRIAEFELHTGLAKLYNAAVSLINHVQLCDLRGRTFAKYLPVVYFLNIWQAAFIIGKLLFSPMKEFLDLGSGKESYLTAVSIASRASILKHDIAHRSSGIMRSMWQLFRTLDERELSNLSISIRTRMSASVFFDSLLLLRSRVGMITLNSRNEQESGNDDDDDEEEEEQEEEEVSLEEVENVPAPTDSEEPAVTQNSSPSSVSSKSKKVRSLSGTHNAEGRARKIIRTIPHDPQPISAKDRSIFKDLPGSLSLTPSAYGQEISSTQSFHHLHSNLLSNLHLATNRFKGTNGSNGDNGEHRPVLPGQTNEIIRSDAARSGMKTSEESGPAETLINHATQPASQNATHSATLRDGPADKPTEQAKGKKDFLLGFESTDSLELDLFDLNGDLIWKDVDSVMNEFGFSL